MKVAVDFEYEKQVLVCLLRLVDHEFYIGLLESFVFQFFVCPGLLSHTMIPENVHLDHVVG